MSKNTSKKVAEKVIDKNRRDLLGTGLALGAITGAAVLNGPRDAQAAPHQALGIPASELGLNPSSARDQSGALQYAIDKAVERKLPLLLQPGNYIASRITLRPDTHIIGVPTKTRIIYGGNSTFIRANNAQNINLQGIELNGNGKPLDLSSGANGLLSLVGCQNLTLKNIHVSGSLVNGIDLRNCSGKLSDLTVDNCTNTGIFSLNGNAIGISHSTINDCGNNGIQIWASKPVEDGTIISNCHIHNILAKAGGDGQNGNGINVFKAGSVTITANRITDCAFTAIRGNAASNIIMSNNNCARLGEVALYAEFGFQGAVISNNLIDQAATGISVTNFKEGGRLSVVTGNLIRNLKRRKGSEDARGIGIGVEADSVVTGNIIENAETMGLAIGCGKYMRDVSATGNIIRNAQIGIGISAEPIDGLIHVASNMISGAKKGAIRAMLFDKPTGPDLINSSAESYRNFALLGNVAS